MTPEQRETLELLVYERESRKFHGLGDRVINARELDALRAALAPPPTCGTCADLLKRLRGCGQLSGYWTSEIDDALVTLTAPTGDAR